MQDVTSGDDFSNDAATETAPLFEYVEFEFLLEYDVPEWHDLLLAQGVVPIAPYNPRNTDDPFDTEYSVSIRECSSFVTGLILLMSLAWFLPLTAFR